MEKYVISITIHDTDKDNAPRQISIDDLIDMIATKINANDRIIIKPESLQAELLIQATVNALESEDESPHSTL